MRFRMVLFGAAAALLVAGTPARAEDSLAATSGFGAPVPQQALEAHRAGESPVQLNLQETRATLQDNNALHTVSGANSIGGDAFRDASGFPVAVQNSGNNVIIQNAFILNLEMR